MRCLVLAALLAPVARTDPALNANFNVGRNGVSLSTSISTTAGGLGVSVSG